MAIFLHFLTDFLKRKFVSEAAALDQCSAVKMGLTGPLSWKLGLCTCFADLRCLPQRRSYTSAGFYSKLYSPVYLEDQFIDYYS